MSLTFPELVERDYDKYHGGPDESQTPAAGPIGLEHNGELYCVGCLYCTPPPKEREREIVMTFDRLGYR